MFSFQEKKAAAAELKREMKKAALQGLSQEKALQRFAEESEEGKLARKYFDRWNAKYNKKKRYGKQGGKKKAGSKSNVP